MPEQLRLGIVGSGRLAAAVDALATAESISTVSMASRHPESWTEDVDVVVDCAAPAATSAVVAHCAEHRRPLVEAVSGLAPAQLDALAELGGRTAVVLAPNLTLGNYLQHRALAEIAGVLAAMRRGGVEACPEASVLERHPVTKRDRPSATALGLAQAWQSRIDPVADVASVRAGGPVSDHTIALTWPDQELAVVHRVGSLQAAAAGSIGLAEWARSAPSGVHTAHDVFDEMVAGWQTRPQETEYAR